MSQYGNYTNIVIYWKTENKNTRNHNNILIRQEVSRVRFWWKTNFLQWTSSVIKPREFQAAVQSDPAAKVLNDLSHSILQSFDPFPGFILAQVWKEILCISLIFFKSLYPSVCLSVSLSVSYLSLSLSLTIIWSIVFGFHFCIGVYIQISSFIPSLSLFVFLSVSLSLSWSLLYLSLF